MRTSVIGYPRIGKRRELKFSVEQYWKGGLPAEDLYETAKKLRAQQWLLQKEKGIDFIPSGDFSFYDQFLDTAVLFHIIPKRYLALGLSPLDTYFAMARGYQGSRGDVKALAMKKWFCTNYHYMAAEIEDDTGIFLSGTKPFEEYAEAKALGIETKPVVTGPFTLLKLLHYSGSRKAADFAPALAEAFRALLQKFGGLGTQWVALDEPALVQDLTEEDRQLLVQLYRDILPAKGSVRILVQTCFGHVQDCYRDLCSLAVDGIGLDFTDGPKNFDLIREYGFPKDKVLFAGLVSGKNIWKNNYAKTLTALETLQKSCEVVLGTSCSLLHVPYTLAAEKSLPESRRAYFSFAEEKLQELSELKALADVPWQSEMSFLKNEALFGRPRPDSFDEAVQKRMAAMEEKDFIRTPCFAKRESLQREKLRLPLFPTTTIGSFPQTADVKKNRSAYKKGEISKEAYIRFNQNKIASCIRLQEELDLDVLVHGEYERNDMVEYFGEHLNGFLFTENGWVQSYGTRCVKPPIIWGDVSRRKPITVFWSVYAQSLTKKPVKGMLTGPVTILNWSFPREDLSLKASAYQIALAIRDEVLDLEKSGISVIQIDEAALREKLPLRRADRESCYLSWAIPAFRLTHSGVKPGTQIHTHMCYSEFTDMIPAIDAMDADVITFEASRSDLEILDALQKNHFRTQVGPGVYDIHSPRVPGKEELHASMEQILQKTEPRKLWINPDCGLKTRGEEETTASLRNMVAAAHALRDENSGII